MPLFLRSLLICLLASGAAVAAVADEKEPRTPSAAHQVLAAWREGKTYQLVALARQDEPDPWVVADHLCRLGAHEAALAFARAAVRPDTTRLAEYVEKRGKRKPDAKVRAAYHAADAAETKEAAAAVLAQLEPVLGQGDEYEQIRLEVARGNVLSTVERYGESAEAFTGAGRLAERLGWLAMAARAYRVAGEAAYQDANHESMLMGWEGYLRVEQGRENDAGIAEGLMLVGLVHIELGHYHQGESYLRESLAANEALGNDDGVAWVLNNLATVHNRRGEHDREQAALERALTLARKVGNRFRVASILCDQGAMHCSLYEFEKARAALRKSMAMYRELKHEDGAYQCIGTIGLTYAEEGDHVRAIEHYEQVLAYYRRTHQMMFRCAVLNSLGYSYLETGKLDRARKYEEEAVRVGKEVSDPWWEAHARQSLADVLLAQGHYEEAERHLERSLTVARQLAAPLLQMVAHRGLAETWLLRDRIARAVHHSKLAMERAEALLAGLAHAQASSVRNAATRVYEVATRAAVAWGQPGAVFAAMENARAGALLEVLENRKEIRAVQIPEALRKREREAKLASLAALRKYQRAMEDGDLRKVRQRRALMEGARARVAQVVAQIQRVAKSPASVLYPQAATLEEIRGELSPNEALVLYSLIDEEALAFVVTKKTAKTVSLGPRDAIVAAAGERPDRPEADADALVDSLRRLLIDPLDLSDRSKRILISPDGLLGFTPFSLLVPKVEIVYVPSGTAYRVLRHARHERGQGVLALGDPDYGVRLPAEPKIAMRGGMRLIPLPATREEAQRIGDVVLLGRRATKSGLLAALQRRVRWEAVHLACHGLVDPARPSRTALALAFEEDGSSLLNCDEVFTRSIPADLTVLSACETGKGVIYRSEGIVGLAQAFMLAGSPRVLVSLWKVDDEATQALMLKFYELWRPKGGKPALSAAAALERAQAYVRSQKKWQHPYYWAAWVLWGLP